MVHKELTEKQPESTWPSDGADQGQALYRMIKKLTNTDKRDN